jgi:hypothetical protein
MMSPTNDKKLGTRRRKLLTQRLREYFDGLRADLETDSEAFFRNVMAQAERRPDQPHVPQPRRG